MEQYIAKLSECQLSENRLRAEREAMIKRHERELEELEAHLATISTQRTHIIDDFKTYLDSVELSQQQLTESSVVNPKLHRAGSAEATLASETVARQTEKPFQSLLRVSDTLEPGKISPTCTSPLLTYHSASSSPSPPEANGVSAIEKTGEDAKPKRSFKFVHRLTMSKSTGSMPTAITVTTPTTTQIESMLTKVRENVHALDNGTLNKCIDLLSSRIIKEKEMSAAQVSSPEPVLPQKAAPLTARPIPEVAKEPVKPAPIKVVDNLIKSESQSPQQPSSPKRKMETPEERRLRIEQVLFERPGSKVGNQALSRSTNSLNDLDLTPRPYRSTLRPNPSFNSRFGNRSSNKTKVRRNHSLSPLRFGLRLSEERDVSKEGSQDSFEMRRFRSDQQLDSDSVSMLSADESSLEGGDTQDEQPERLPVTEEEQDAHLLAPSKVAKSQDLFKQVFFPSDLRQKPLMSKEELAQTRQESAKKKAQSLSLGSQDSSRGSESPDESTASLKVDYLSHLRNNSASPEQRARVERELNSLNNSKKFSCFKDFWEKKTNEVIDKKREFEEWHQTNSVVSAPTNPQAPLQRQQATTQLKYEPKTVSSNATFGLVQKKQPQQQQQAKTQRPSKPKGVLVRQDRVKSSHPVKSSIPISTAQQQQQQQSNPKPAKTFATPPNKQQPTPAVVENKPNRQDEIENDQVMKRLRNIQQDIRQRRIKQLQQPPSQPQQQQQQNRPSIQAAKSLDLTYYPLKVQVPKSAAVRIIQPNGTEPPPTKNRIRLIRSASRDESLEEPPVVIQRAGPRSQVAANNGHRHTVEIGQDLSNAFVPFHQQQFVSRPQPPALAVHSATPMRSTYF